jgi:dihydroorotate dehydrogenase (NAD+) catalytic subunit
MGSLHVDLGPERLATPLIAASGTVGSLYEFSEVIDFSLYGAATAKSVAPEAWPGRKPPRLAPVGSGMLNSIGIQNPGVEHWLASSGARLASIPTKVWASVVAHDVAGFATVAAAMDEAPVSALEVNLSCPNLEGDPFALDPELSHTVVRAVRQSTSKPIGAKLSPDARPVGDVAAAVLDAGADWLVMGNTVMGAAIDIETRRPRTRGTVSGYSGTPIRPITMRCVLELRTRFPTTPIVACGGVTEASHVIEYALAGADAVGIGSAHFAKPRIARELLGGITRYLERHGVTRFADLRGRYEPWPS